MALFYTSDGQQIEANDADPQITDKVASGQWRLPQGLTIPGVHNESGDAVDIPTESAQWAFQNGYRWQTPQDANADAANKTEAIKAAAYDDPQTAAETGLVNSLSFGGVKYLAPDATEELEKRNPISYGVGSLVGAVGNPILGAVGTAVKAGAAGVAADVLAGTSQASRIAAEASPLLGSAAEGMVYGLHGTMTENALGNPHELAENILVGGGLGALGGVLFHGGDLAAPYIKGATQSATDAASDAAEYLGQKITSKAGEAVLNARGAADAVPDFNTLVADTEGRAAIDAAGGMGAAEKLENTANAGLNDLTKEQMGLQRDIERMIQKAPPAEAKALKEVVEQNKGDLSNIAEDLQDRQVQKYAEVEPQLTADSRPDPNNATFKSQALDLANTLAPAGATSKNVQLDNLATNIRAAIEANPGETLGDTYKLRSQLKQVIPQSSNKLAEIELKDARNEIMNFNSGPETSKWDPDLNRFERDRAASPMNQSGAGHATYSDYAEKVGDLESKYKSVQDFKRILKSNAGDAGDLIGALSSKQGKMVLASMPDRAPEIQAILDRSGTALQKSERLQNAVESFNADAARTGNPNISGEQYQELIEQMGLKSKMTDTAMDRLRSLDVLDATKENSPLDRWAQVQKALGNDIDPIMRDLAKASPTYEAAKRISQLPEWKNGLLDMASRYGWFAGPSVGVKAAAVKKIVSGVMNPMTMVNTLSKIERAANGGLSAINAGVAKAVDGLLNSGTRRGIISGAVQREIGNMNKQKENFPKQVDALAQLTNPETAQDIIASKTANLSRAPGVSSALAMKTVQIASFLQTKVPKDPLAAYQLPGTKSQWQPSDAQLSQFNRYVAAAADPKSVLESVKNGTVTQEETEALQSLYPSIYQKLQTGILDGITKKGNDVSYQQKVTLGTLFNMPTDVSLRPDFIAQLQNRHAPQPDQGGRPEGRSIKIDLDPMNNVATETTRITNK